MGLKSKLILSVPLFLVCAITIPAQDDETRQGTGLPTKIGENVAAGSKMNISGRVKLVGAEKLKPPPVITVNILMSGTTLDRTTANDAGLYLVQNVPRQNVTVMIEVDGNEVARQLVVASPMGSARLDFTVQWPVVSSQAKPGVVSAGQTFSRTENNEELFQKALAASKANETVKAVELFNQILSSEPKDFVAWTELGTVYFRANSLQNAEACYFKAIELKKDYFAALLNAGKLYIASKRFNDAIIVLTSAVASNPASPDAHQYLGEAYLQAKKGSFAVPELNEAIRLAPIEKAELHLRLASLYDAAGIKANASAEYKAFLEKKPDWPEKKQLEKYISDNPPK